MATSIKAKLLALTLFASTASVIALYPIYQSNAALTPIKPAVQPFKPVAQLPTTQLPVIQEKPKVEVVFVLDTTGSMSGLIQAAKENIWSIATTMASAEPAPEIKIGLVAYRDRQDAYVTQVTDLSTDLDSMYARLMDFQADGGGDTPESVNQALYDAVHKISWSQDENSYKVIFLVGDAPAHMDYQDEVKYPETLKIAGQRGIVINTIQAGSAPMTRQEWMHIAHLNQGEYFQVAQSGNAVAVATPFDDQIAGLSRELDDTRLFYGSQEQRAILEKKKAATDKLHAASSPASQAKRAMFNTSAAGAGNFLGDSELVEDVASGKVELDSIDESYLPEPMKTLSKEEQAQLIKQKSAERESLRAQIADLTRHRQAFIEAELKASGEEEESLDYKIYSAVKEQAAERGLSYEAAPAY
ncbi:vWA domain-containing protein [Hahella ganghwensis]|uniref:vWA domain-containing protein n=1 Tax=Hahella ganghwensis TaxID=286420 RepID=UPI000360AEF2|nr:vWA domain-containing protein [Hahella ganghwensis]